MFLLFRVTRRIVITLQKFTWAVQGVERIRRDAARGLQFKQSAHVQEIFWKRKFVDHSVADPSCFITTHKCFRPPQCIFRPNVSLYCMTRREAVFVEVAEGENVYKSKHANYLYQVTCLPVCLLACMLACAPCLTCFPVLFICLAACLPVWLVSCSF